VYPFTQPTHFNAAAFSPLFPGEIYAAGLLIKDLRKRLQRKLIRLNERSSSVIS